MKPPRLVYSCMDHDDCREHPEVGVACWQSRGGRVSPEPTSPLDDFIARVEWVYANTGRPPLMLPVTEVELDGLRKEMKGRLGVDGALYKIKAKIGGDERTFQAFDWATVTHAAVLDTGLKIDGVSVVVVQGTGLGGMYYGR